jgi:predicted nucleotide-binding protein (sugar kinase/HSP70/actin superfamily)
MVISFPIVANYSVPIKLLLKSIFPYASVLPPAPITRKTVQEGEKHSPDFVCMPFKYNIGNFIEALEKGADTLIQAAGGCRYGNYFELQEEILKNLGYKFNFVDLFEGRSLFKLHKKVKSLGSTISIKNLLKSLLLTAKIGYLMDKIDFYIRENICFEATLGAFEKTLKEFLFALESVSGFKSFKAVKKRYTKLFHNMPLNKPKNPIRVGIIGELYELMEPYANFYMEKELCKYKISVTRFTNATYLLFKKRFSQKRVMKNAKSYVKYRLGADGAESVAHLKQLALKGYDGVIHVKPFGCTPEINAMPALINVSNDYKIPVLYFSFDAQSSEVAIRTRLEAFYDMLTMKREGKI